MTGPLTAEGVRLQQVAKFINPELSQKMKANDMDVYQLLGGDGRLKVEGPEEEMFPGENLKECPGLHINKIRVSGAANASDLLKNNDINACGAAISVDVMHKEVDGKRIVNDINYYFHFSPEFAEFLVGDDNHTLKAM